MLLKPTLLTFMLLTMPVLAQPAAWDLSRVKLTCTSGDCPSSVGAILFLDFATKPPRIGRCSAALIANDRVLTTAHCDSGFPSGVGYFFHLQQGRTVIHTLVAKIMSVFDYSSVTATDIGVGEDVAIWRLSQPVSDTLGLEVSRQIPPDMSQLVAYPVEDPNSDFMNLQITPKFCTTRPHLFSFEYFAGADDNHIGLKLFGCSVIFGDGGAPVFVPGRLGKIEAMITARNLNADGGFANRLQCLGQIAGLPEPSMTCSRAIPPAP